MDRLLSNISRAGFAALICGVVITAASLNCPAQESDAGQADAVSIFDQAQDLHEKGDLKGAIDLYRSVLRLQPELVEASYQCGVAHLALGENAEAELSFRQALEVKPDWTLAMTALGSLLVQRGSLSEAESLLTKVLAADGQNQPALAAMADLRLRTNAPPDVLTALLKRIADLTAKANPTANAWSARAALEYRLGKRKEAVSSIEHALSDDPNSRSALYMAAEIALAEGDLEKAGRSIRMLESISAGAEPLEILKAEVLAADGRADEAVKLLDAITAPSAAVATARSRIVLLQSASAADLERQLAADNADAANAAVLGRLCSMLRRDDPAKAVEYCRRAVETAPDNIGYAVGYGAALVQAKKYDAAIATLRRIEQIAPDNWFAHANLATALFRTKRFAEAKPEYLWLTNKQPNVAAGYFLLAITFDELGEYADAMANYQQYLRLADPDKNKPDIERVTLRLPSLQRQLKDGGSKRNGGGN